MAGAREGGAEGSDVTGGKERAAALREVKRTAARLERVRAAEAARLEEFFSAVTRAVRVGIPVREVGAAAGVSGMRVSQIVHRVKRGGGEPS